MQEIFNRFIDSYIDNNIGISNEFLPEHLARRLRANLLELFSRQQLHQAGTGNAGNVNHNKEMRSDVIHWLDRTHDDADENEFFDLIDKFVIHLNETCYAGVTNYEFHYTLYQPGSFYNKHIDRFRNNDSRKFSMILYLNENWTEEDGGELRIYENGKEPRNISPDDGKAVFFKSDELEHQVLLTNKNRMSITGWLKG